VPLAIPLIAGPAAMATLMLLMAREPWNWPRWLGALLLAWGASSVILLLANQLARLLGKRTIIAIERLMDWSLPPSPWQMLIDGIGQAYTTIAQASDIAETPSHAVILPAFPLAAPDYVLTLSFPRSAVTTVHCCCSPPFSK